MVRKSEFPSRMCHGLFILFNLDLDAPILKLFLALSASCSRPNGVTNGDFEFRVAAIVRAGSRQRNTAATSRNFPRCTSVGNLLRRRPIGVISSVAVRAPTSIKAAFAR